MIIRTTGPMTKHQRSDFITDSIVASLLVVGVKVVAAAVASFGSPDAAKVAIVVVCLVEAIDKAGQPHGQQDAASTMVAAP